MNRILLFIIAGLLAIYVIPRTSFYKDVSDLHRARVVAHAIGMADPTTREEVAQLIGNDDDAGSATDWSQYADKPEPHALDGDYAGAEAADIAALCEKRPTLKACNGSDAK